MRSKNHEANDYGARFGFANHLALIACFISVGQGAERNVSE